LTVKDKLKAKHLLEKEKVGAGAGLIGEECIPGTIEGYVDVRVLNPCQYLDHVCVSNPWSSLGGTCIGIGTKVGGFVLSNHVLELGSKFRRNSFRLRAQNIAGTGILTETSISFRSFPEYQRSLMLSN
jgi:hypothetical protein